MKKDILSDGFDKAEVKLRQVGNDTSKLPSVIANFLMVYSAQGVIDNGGYRYFFESNWPQNPPYSCFVEAYTAIGCIQQSAELKKVIATFPFEAPHLHEAARNKYMDENYDEDNHEIKGWGNKLCGDEEVWEQLEKYYLCHKALFT